MQLPLLPLLVYSACIRCPVHNIEGYGLVNSRAFAELEVGPRDLMLGLYTESMLPSS